VLVSKDFKNYKTIINKTDLYDKYTNIYKKQLRKNKYIALDGAVNVLPIINKYQFINNHKTIANIVLNTALFTVSYEWSLCNRGANDNFCLTNNMVVASFNSIARFIPIDQMFNAINTAREHWSFNNNHHNHKEDEEKDVFYFNYPIEFRFITVKNKALLTNLKEGTYISIEVLNNRTNKGHDSNNYAKYFMALERDLAKLSSESNVHFGKGHSYDYDPKLHEVRPFTTDFEPVLSFEQIKTFKKLMNKYDPISLFSSGSMMKYFKQ